MPLHLNIPNENKEIAPFGAHEAVCCAVVDLGTQDTPYGVKHQLYMGWELPDALNSRGYPFVLGKFYSLTGDPRSALRADLDGWAGKAFADAQLADLDLLELVGRTAMLAVTHSTGQTGRLRAQITSVAPSRSGLQRNSVSNALAFGFDPFDPDAYNRLPQWLRDIVGKSPEYARATGAQTELPLADRLKAKLTEGKPLEDDDIPF